MIVMVVHKTMKSTELTMIIKRKMLLRSQTVMAKKNLKLGPFKDKHQELTR